MTISTRESIAEYQRRVCRAIDFVNAHLADNPTVSEIAAAAPFSSFHFQRLFRAIVGETVADFTRRLRLEAAARRLRFRTAEDITTIAFSLGFSSSQNFAKAFKLHFGISPSQYRASHVTDKQAASDHPTDAEPNVPELTLRDASNSPLSGVTIQSLPARRVVYVRHFGSYRDAGVESAFQELTRWAAARGRNQLPDYLGIPWDDAEITDSRRCRFDACLIVGDDNWFGSGVNVQSLPAARYAVYQSEIIGHDFERPWTQLMQHWLPSSGFQPADGPRLERYLTDGTHDPLGHWHLEICLPVIPL